MRRRTTTTVPAALTVCLLAAALLAAPHRQAHADTGLLTTGSTRSVTLVTGDRVTLDDRDRVTIHAAPGRDKIAFSTRHIDGHVRVVPADAEPMLARGLIDTRLFDVTTLIDMGYDDRSRSDLPLIVTHGKNASAFTDSIAQARVRVERRLPAVNGVAVTARKASADALWKALASGPGQSTARQPAPGVHQIWLDGKRRTLLDRSVPQIGAPTAWKGGYDGRGVTVAVLDTGIDSGHPDLKDRIAAERNFSDDADVVDRNGHGTHVASTVAGSGAASSGTHRGVAPGARLLNAKVLDESGSGNESGIIAGMQWAVDEGARILNLSLGGENSPGTDPLEAAVGTLSERTGALFVIAAGNEGEAGARTVGSPGSAPGALTVGAVDRADALAPFSSRGPTADGVLKPDLTAPGTDIVAAGAAEGWQGRPAGDGYVSMSGTSMATPHVAGAAAILAQLHPDWDGERLKATLTASVASAPERSSYLQGSGRVDVAAALEQHVTTSPAALDFGVQRWPHGDDPLIDKSLTYRNTGAQAVTLDLSARAFDPEGRPAAEGMFQVMPARIAVPAGGTATATVTADTRAGDSDGLFGGTLTAAVGGQPVARTALGAEREGESYDLTIRHLDTGGQPSEYAYTTLKGTDAATSSVWRTVQDADGEVTLRLPHGRYALEGTVLAGPAGDEGAAVLLRPRLDLTADTTVVMDARTAGPIDITAPDPAAKSVERRVSYEVNGAHGYSNSYYLPPGSPPHRFAGAGTALSLAEAPLLIAEVFSSPAATYRLAWNRPASAFSGLRAPVRRAELAEVTVAMGAPAPGRTAVLSAGPLSLGGNWTGVVTPLTALPSRRTEYLLRGSDVRWEYNLYQYTPEQNGGEAVWDASLTTAPMTFSRARHLLRMNFAVFGPVLSAGDRSGALRAGAVRRGDVLHADLPLFGDGGGNAGESAYTEARTSLTADGAQVFTSDRPLRATGMVLPEGEHAYRLHTEVSRPVTTFPLSTRVAAEWTFRSASVPEGKERRIPLSAVRFTPRLGHDGTARAGTRLEVPYTVQGAAVTAGVRDVKFEVSYDEAVTWLPVKPRGDGSLLLDHPRGPGSVSFRVHLTDSEGNTVRQTVERAYLLR